MLQYLQCRTRQVASLGTRGTRLPASASTSRCQHAFLPSNKTKLATRINLTARLLLTYYSNYDTSLHVLHPCLSCPSQRPSVFFPKESENPSFAENTCDAKQIAKQSEELQHKSKVESCKLLGHVGPQATLRVYCDISFKVAGAPLDHGAQNWRISTWNGCFPHVSVGSWSFMLRPPFRFAKTQKAS